MSVIRKQQIRGARLISKGVLSLLAWALFVLLPAGLCPAADAVERNVVVISLDGFPGYLLDDPQASLPVLRGLAASGAVAVEGMHVSNPSVTWPNHTTLMTGAHPERHGVLFNGLLERPSPGAPVRVVPAKSQADLVKIPLLFDLLKESGLTSSAINWPCTRGSQSLVDNFPDVPDHLEYTNSQLKQELSERGLLERFEAGGGVVRDEIWTAAACNIIKRRMPRLLVVHLLNLDSTHHEHGPLTHPGYTAAALLDSHVGRILAALDEAKIRDKTAVIVVSDHGFEPVTKGIRPNAVLRREGLLELKGNQIASAKVMVVPEGGIGMVYLLDPATAEENRKTVHRLFEATEGIEAVLDAGDFPRFHLPLPSQNPRMADMIIAAKGGYSISSIATGDQAVAESRTKTGSHGYLSTNPKMNGLFVAAGAGIKPQTRLKTIDNVDIAPTASRLIGYSLKDASGRILTEILEESR